MKIFTSAAFKGHWPVGTAAVIVAKDRREALTLLEAAVKKGGFPLEFSTSDPKERFAEIDTSKAHAIVLCDGDY